MKKEKVEKLVTACTVAGVILLVFLFGVIVWQLFEINRVKKAKEELRQEIDILKEEFENGENDLKYYSSSLYLEQKAREWGFIFPGDILYEDSGN